MNSQKPLIFIGSGGHALPLIEVAQLLNYKIKGFITNSTESVIKDIPILGTDDSLFLYSPKDYELVLAIGNITLSNARRTIAANCEKLGFNFCTLIDPRAIVSNIAVIKAGAQILAGAYVGPQSVIGKNAIINTRSVIEHQSEIGNYTHIAPGSIICGNVKIGEDVFIGASTTVIQNVQIENDVSVAAGSVVIRNIEHGKRVKGIPAHAY